MITRNWRILSPIVLLSLLALLAAPAAAQQDPQDTPPAPPLQIECSDTPNDRGYAIDVSWLASDDDNRSGLVDHYVVARAVFFPGRAKSDLIYEVLTTQEAVADRQRISFTDVGRNLENGLPYIYRIEAVGSGGVSAGYATASVIAEAQWFNAGRWNMLLGVLVLCTAIIYWIQKARTSDIHLRPVAGLKAFDEAVGRATEMGQPVLFVPGIMDMDQIETLAGVSILGYVAKMTSRYETPLEVPVSRSLVMAHAREVVKESYLSTGRPDLYHDDMIHYLTDDQFAYAAAVDGIMLRQKPAACFYQGKFYAESLILAETGNSIRAIQIAGTASPAQLPFFITACDYTLIGEEFFAASAYLSKEKKLIGSIRGQDVGKLIFMFALIVGVIYVSLEAVGVNLPAWLNIKHLFSVSGG
jgi:hypothetical protein